MPKSSVNSKPLSPQRWAAEAVSVVVRGLLVAAVRVYRAALSPLLGPACRFAPSCSLYAEEAIVLHGPIVGAVMAVKRIVRCHPWNQGGYDPVPGRSR